MTSLEKILLSIVGFLVAAMLLMFGFFQYKSSQMQSALNNSMIEQKQLIDGIVRSQANYVSQKDLKDFADKNQINLDVIKKDLGTLNASLIGINQISVNSSGQHVINVPSTTIVSNSNEHSISTVTCKDGTVEKCPDEDKFGYLKNIQVLKLNENFATLQVPIGSTSFNASVDKPWTVDVLPRKYTINTIIGIDQDNKHIVYNKLAIDVGGKSYTIPVDQGKFIEQYPQESFSFWSPKIFLGIGGGVNISEVPPKGMANATIEASIFSYGKTKVNPSFTFLGLGAGYDAVNQRPQGIISPINMNIGEVGNIPVLSNTYVGPDIIVDTAGKVGLGVSVRVGL